MMKGGNTAPAGIRGMREDERERFKKALRTGAALAAIGLAYALFIRFTGVIIPCPIRAVTGYKCPGCGISHYFLSLLAFDLHGAYHANPFIFILMPAAVLYGLFRFYVYVKMPRRGYAKWENIGAWAVLCAAVVFGVARNF